MGLVVARALNCQIVEQKPIKKTFESRALEFASHFAIMCLRRQIDRICKNKEEKVHFSVRKLFQLNRKLKMKK